MVKLRLEVNKEEGTIIFHNVPAILDSQKKDFVKAIFLHLPDGTYLLRCGKEHRRMISDTRIRGLYYSLLEYNHTYKKLLYFIKKSSIL